MKAKLDSMINNNKMTKATMMKRNYDANGGKETEPIIKLN